MPAGRELKGDPHYLLLGPGLMEGVGNPCLFLFLS